MSSDSDLTVPVKLINKTKTNISKGDVILTSEPFAYVLKGSLRNLYCENCLKRKPHLQRCSRCALAYYCNGDCQKASWNIHKKECLNLKKLKPNFPPETARLIARVIFRLQDAGQEFAEVVDEKHSRKFKDLINHYSDVKKDAKSLEHFASLVQVLEKYIGKENLPNSADLLGIYGRICVNSYSITDKDLNCIGTGIYLAGSVFDHSCRPNAYASFKNTSLIIRSLVNWPQFDLNKVRISYIDVLNTMENRRNELKDGYYFLCDCKLCKDSEREKIASSIICGNESCQSPVPVDDSSETIDPCPKCGFSEFEEGTKERYHEIIQFTQDKFLEMKNKTYFDVCQAILKRQGDLLHPLNVWRVRTLDAAFEAAVDLNSWDFALEYGPLNLEGLRFYYGSTHPTYALTLLKLGKLQLYRMQLVDAVRYLSEVEPIFRVSHGIDSVLYKEEVSPSLKQAKMELQMVKNGGFRLDRSLPHS